MATWIFQYNPDVYQIERCVEQEEKWVLDVNQHRKSIKVGNRAYVWVSGGNRQATPAGIIASCKILSLPRDVEADPSDPYLKPGHESQPCCVVDVKFEHSFTHGRILRATLQKDERTERLSILKDYWKGTNFKVEPGEEEAIEGFIGELLAQEYREGAVKDRSCKGYERDANARNECIAYYGYVCQVCKVKLGDVYGDVGKDFIHVHHIEFLSSAGERNTAPQRDLITVCLNCHSMLHRKVNGEYLSVEELKERIKTTLPFGRVCTG